MNSSLMDIGEDFPAFLRPLYSRTRPQPAWTTDGFLKPDFQHWRSRDGRQIPIVDMDNRHLLNSINFLVRTKGEDAKEWKIYKNLVAEATKRNIYGSHEWDD